MPGDEEEEKEEEEGEEETARPLSLGQSLPYNLNTIPDTYTKDCVENNLFHKGITYINILIHKGVLLWGKKSDWKHTVSRCL